MSQGKTTPPSGSHTADDDVPTVPTSQAFPKFLLKEAKTDRQTDHFFRSLGSW